MIAGFDKDEKAWIEVKGRGRTNLHPFAGLIHNYMESYWVVVRGCYHLRKGPKAERDWLKNIRGLGARMYRKGEIRQGGGPVSVQLPERHPVSAGCEYRHRAPRCRIRKKNVSPNDTP